MFLIALPLCLGIAAASGCPPIAGVLTAIVGGLVCSPIGSAPLTIKGPAAGLIVIVLGAVTELGGGDAQLGYERMLAVGVVAGLAQVLLAATRAARLASALPPAVVRGMLAAIGLTIIAKQVPVALGVLDAHGEALEMLLAIPSYVAALEPTVAAIGLVAFLVLTGWPYLPAAVQRIPAPLAALVVTVPLALGADLAPAFLVDIPDAVAAAITFPDFSAVLSPTSLKYIAMFTLVGSIESLLSVLAVDAMDPREQASDLDRDLLTVGIGNVLAALIGGLPMISEIVRSRANIDAGATGPRANFVHGAILLLFVALLPGVLRLLPLTALAAMLIATGVRLASPRQLESIAGIGRDQLLLFATTLLLTLATDLLVGVAGGLLVAVLGHVVRAGGVRPLFSQPAELQLDGDTLHVRIRGAFVFTNLLRVQRAILTARTPGVKHVRVDVSTASLVDHTSQVRLLAMADEWPGVTLSFVGLDRLAPLSAHARSTRRAA